MENIRKLAHFYQLINPCETKKCYQIDPETTQFQCNGWQEYYEHVLACGNIRRQIILIKTWGSVWTVSLLL